MKPLSAGSCSNYHLHMVVLKKCWKSNNINYKILICVGLGFFHNVLGFFHKVLGFYHKVLVYVQILICIGQSLKGKTKIIFLIRFPIEFYETVEILKA
jgi:hypothetical protein